MTQLLYIDLFCGAGGTSTGVNTARLDGEQCAKVIACVNHDVKAIASHAANHPEAAADYLKHELAEDAVEIADEVLKLLKTQ